MDKFIVNIIHRPEMVPEYAEKVTGHGKEEDLGTVNRVSGYFQVSAGNCAQEWFEDHHSDDLCFPVQ